MTFNFERICKYLVSALISLCYGSLCSLLILFLTLFIKGMRIKIFSLMNEFFIYYIMKRFSATLVLVFGNFGKLWEDITHDYPSTVVGRKKLEREVGFR